MNLRHLRIFLAVCQSGNNVTRAAASLYMSQPAVTIAIREMEKDCGSRLFDRIGRRLFLTPAGEQVRSYAQRILALEKDLDMALESSGVRDAMRLGASMTVGSRRMPEYVRAYLQGGSASAGGSSAIRVTIAPSRELEKKLLMNELDVAITEIPVHNDALIAEAFLEDTLEIITPASAPWRGNTSMDRETFCGQPFLLREKGSGTRDIFDREMAAHGIEIAPIWEAASTEAIIRAVECGMGISVIPRQLAAPAILGGAVSRAEVPGITFRQTFFIVRHRDKVLTPAMDRFVRIVREWEAEA